MYAPWSKSDENGRPIDGTQRMNGSPLNIVVTGVTVSGNMGGAAMLRATMEEMVRRAPGSTFQLLSYRPAADRACKKIPNLDIVSADYRLLVLFYLPLAFLLALPLKFPWFRRLLRIIPYFKALHDADVVIDLCGIAFVDGRGLPLLAYNVACVLPALAMRRPVVKLSQALGPFKAGLNRFAAKNMLSRCSLVVARGAQSYKHLLTLDLRNIKSLPDTTFCLHVSDEAKKTAHSILIREGISSNAVVISPSEVVRRLCAKNEIDFEHEMRRFIERLLDDGLSVLLLPHSLAIDGSKNDDVGLCRRLFDVLRDHENIFLIDEHDDPVLLRAIIGNCSLHVGCRFHGIVGALAMGVPTLTIGWSHKYQEMAELLQSDRWAIEWTNCNAEKMYALFSQLWTERETVRHGILEGLPDVIHGARQNYEYAIAMLPQRA